MMYRAAHGWGIQPSEYWEMTLCEWYELAEYYMGQQGIAGTSITEDRYEELKAWADEVREKKHAA